MTRKRSTVKGRRKVTFSLEATDANEVVLMGDFNQWNPKSHPMKRDGNGKWIKAIMLSPGKYEYKFMVDGKWREDPKNETLRPNCFGTFNNVFDVMEK